jgi:hypothetical protein
MARKLAPCVLGQFQFLSVMGFRPLQQGLQRGVIQPAQHQDLGARQKRAVQFKRRILGGRPYQDHRAVLYHRQETVLLAAVETVNFVDEKQRALSHAAPGARRLKCLFQVGDAGEYRGQLIEVEIEGRGKQPRDGGLAGSRRAPQDHRSGAAIPHHAAQRPFRRQKMILPHNFGQAFGPQAVGQGARRIAGQVAGLEQIGHGAL